MSSLVIIPSRLNATRLPRKPLLELAGKPLIQHVWEGVGQSRLADRIVVATDSEEIADRVAGFGGEALLTSPDHETGTDRVAEAARTLPEYQVVINIQGDEPLMTGSMADQLIGPLLKDPGIEMSALMGRIDNQRDLNDPSVVKVVTDLNGFALFYSRSPIPFNRCEAVPQFRNKGVYGFQRDFLMKFAAWPRGPLERAESLEQLRALEHGARIYVTETLERTHGVNTPEDAILVERILRARLPLSKPFPTPTPSPVTPGRGEPIPPCWPNNPWAADRLEGGVTGRES